MSTVNHVPNQLLTRKLEAIFALTDDERQGIQGLPIQIKEFKTNQAIVQEGDCPSQCCMVLEGATCTYKMTIEGKRQILALHVPGDMPDLQSLHLKVLDINIASISTCKLGFIQHTDLRGLCERYPRLTAAFWRETLVHASIFREWLLNNGQRESYIRIAHLICELAVRLNAVGLVQDDSFKMPATQAELADATGVTPVHMNRVIKALRADGLISNKQSKITIPSWERLKEAGEFDSLYLHLLNKATDPVPTSEKEYH
ncbi:Crp/Fnr family transcriptional regulator [Vreelandella populi]|uniref:Crp/Fnr family transcriptional regulator n=1 Tax=Vreelandella populi TaxID=2498858 RepID=A0A433L8H8_9GAMM|nr:Crp/Fnr family transcriptional regulator [Halomonas populi]RUR43593.1 Crp/Fnr family transcriptional regulator [Halomonas populi]